MMGSNEEPQDELFYDFNLDDIVPQDHLLRDIDRFLDFSELREHLAPYYSDTGRPSVDPELMIRMLLIGYCLGIRAERQLCEEVRLNLAYRWFCKLKITDPVPHHGGEDFAVHASVVKADASRQKHHEDDDDDWGSGSRAIREYLDALKEDGSSIPPAKKVSQTDPMARWTAAPGGPAYYAYSTNYLVDTEAGIIVDVEATTAANPRGCLDEDHGGARQGAPGSRDQAPDRRHGLRHGGDPGLDGQRERHRAACAGVREGRAYRRDLLPIRLRL